MDTFFEPPQSVHALSTEECLHLLAVEEDRGLDPKEVERRQGLYGKNGLPIKKSRGLISVFFSQFFSPLIGLLILSTAMIWWIGEISDACVVLAVVVLNAVMGTFQEGRAERSLQALRKLSSPQTRVLRSGEERVVDASELVPGDIIHLAAGDAIAADMRILQAMRVEVIESSLTGESCAVIKESGALPADTPIYEQRNRLFSGTHLSKGRCVAVVTATGTKTQLGKIALLAESHTASKTPIEKKIDQFGHHLSLVALVCFALLFGVGFLRDLPLSTIFLASVSQLVSLIPEGLPVAITIALAVGVQRMATHHALVRRLHAVETLGSTTVICTDKTGTLTKNEMTVTQISLYGQSPIEVTGVGYSPIGELVDREKRIDPLALKTFLEACVLCNDSRLIQKNATWAAQGDPMEAALLTLAVKGKIDVEKCLSENRREGEIPFDSSHKMMATFHRGFALIKGALEEVLALCSLDAKGRKEIEHEAHLSATLGKRVLAFARFPLSSSVRESFEALKGQGEWLGFASLMDPPREEILAAVALCRKAHIRPIMLTGDHLSTATAIARELGIMREGEIAVEGRQLELFSAEEFRQKIGQIAVYARVQPEQKFKIVEAFQQAGEVVAMTGDGVNDAPALAKADVGIAMGTGTDVAKEAAKMVITDDNFATIVKAVQQGRLVYRNIVKVILYLLGTTFAGALVMVAAVALDYPLPMVAVQILWINVVTEGTITINLVLDPPDGTEMDAPPLRSSDPILSRSNLLKLAGAILVIGGLLFGYFLFLYTKHYPIHLIQTQVFTLLAFCAWFKLLGSRSETRSALNLDFLKNRYLTAGLLLSIALQASVLYNGELNRIFHTVPLTVYQLLLLLALSSLVLWFDELRKWFIRKAL